MSQETLNVLTLVLMAAGLIFTTLNLMLGDSCEILGRRIYPLGLIPAILLIRLAMKLWRETRHLNPSDALFRKIASFLYSAPVSYIGAAAVVAISMVVAYHLGNWIENSVDCNLDDSQKKRKKKQKSKGSNTQAVVSLDKGQERG